MFSMVNRTVTFESGLLHIILGLDTQLRTGNISSVCSQSPLADGQTLPGGEVLCTLAGLGSGEAGRVIRTGDGTDRK